MGNTQIFVDRADAGRRLARLLELRGEGVSADAAVVLGGLPVPSILQRVSEHSDDLIALATRGAGAVQRLMIGSVADKVIRGSDIPVLVLNPGTHPSSKEETHE